MSMTYINWYPGHMKKTKEMMADNMKVVDIVLEVLDARIPISSKNPDIKEISKNKKRVILLNKSDLVEKNDINKWRAHFIESGYADEVIDISCETGYNIKKLYDMADRILVEKKAKYLKRGIQNTVVRIMVAGIPNVGKSSLINKIVKTKATGVANTPGFTKGKQWVKIREGVELLDMPGVLWPKFEDNTVGTNLAITGAIKDGILTMENIAMEFIKRMIDGNRFNVLYKYKLTEEDKNEIPAIILEKIAKNMGMLLKGEKLNIEKAAITVIKDYRAGKLGKIVLDIL